MGLNGNKTSNTRVCYCLLAFYYCARSEPDLLQSLQASLLWTSDHKLNYDKGVLQLLADIPQAFTGLMLPEYYTTSKLTDLWDTPPTDTITQHTEITGLGVCILTFAFSWNCKGSR